MAIAVVLPATAVAAPCTGGADAALPGLTAPASPGPAQAPLRALVLRAQQRSADVQAARLSAEAAAADLDETRAGARPQAALSGMAGHTASRVSGVPEQSQQQASVSLNVSGLLYDGGRQEHLTAWRTRLAEAATLEADSLQEQVALEALMTALERHRYRLQAEVYGQYVSKMGCLAGALQEIVAVDRGRASELVQARKTQAQAQIAVDGVATQVRQIDERLRKLLGDVALPETDLSVPLYARPPLAAVVHGIDRGRELQQLERQAEAARDYARAVSAGRKPQLSWQLSRSATAGRERDSGAWQAGVSVNYPLYDGGANLAAASAALRRADAAERQREAVLATRQARARELHEAAGAALERARSYAEVLRDSDRVRDFTLEQWSQLGRRSLFDVMAAEGEYYNLQVAYINALYDAFSAHAQLRSLGQGLADWLAATPAP
ncbi:TolC family protein [Caldimonas brevitalea]|uniref:Outer membrane protein, adhesin transport system n=1 Tax=Caldimonas brevitalea TaxID=413882 RepID=A0A0G3BKL2_9BURK|nr:TolC family protein [Caldimonas brevitalea]AKJ28528.1 outer membrane protein, adhesin transport system [Caldimonas brevitalea]